MFQTESWPNRVILVMCLKTGEGKSSATITHTQRERLRESERDVTFPAPRHQFCG